MIANKWYCIAQTGTFDSGCTINVSFDSYVIQFSASVKYGSSAINITRCELPLSANLSLRLRESNGLWSVDLLSNNDITPEIVVADSPYWVAVNSVAGAGNIILTIKDISKDFNTGTGGSGGGLNENELWDFLDKYGYTRARDFWKYETTGGGAIHTDYHIIVDGGGAFGGAELGGGGESGGGGISEFYIQLGEGGQKYKLGNSGLPNVVQIPKYPVVPTNVSAFFNDAGYIGGEQAALIFSRISEVEGRVAELEKLWWVDENGNLHTTYNIVVEKGGAFGTGASVDAGGSGGLGRVILVNDSGTEFTSDENGIVRIPDYINKVWFDAQNFASQSWVLSKGYVSESVLVPIREDITTLKKDVADLKGMWTIKDGKLYTTYSIVVEGGGAFGQGASDSGEVGVGKTILITPSGLRYETNDDGYVPIPEWASQDWVNGKGFATQTWVLSKGFLTKNSADLLYAKRAELDDINDTLAELVKMWRFEDGKLFTDYSIVVKGGGSFGEGSESGGGSTGGLGQITIRNQAGQEYKTDANGVVVIPTYLTSNALDGYATQAWVESKKYLTSIPAEYITETELTAKGYAIASEIAKTYATIEALNTTNTNLATVTAGLANVVTTVNALSKNFVNGIAKEAAKVSHALTFGSKTYDGSIARTILASDLDAVTLSGEQIITGAKTFSSLITANGGIKIPYTASLKIGDVTLVEDNGALKILGNLVVTGGGAFGDGASSGGGGGEGFSKIIIQTESGQSYTTNDAGVVTIPNYITSAALNGYATQSWVEGKKYLTGITSAMVTSALDYTPYNSANFTKANIKSTLGIADWALAASKPSYSWSEVTGKPTLATVATSGKYSDLSGVPTSLPASDVYAWAKAATKPTYTASEVGALSEGGGIVRGVITLSGNSVTNVPLNIATPSMGYTGYIRFGGGFDTHELGHLGFSAKGVPAMSYGGVVNTLIHTGNYADTTDKRYLQLSGGTISKSSYVPLVIQNTASDLSTILYKGTSGDLGYLGFNGASNPIYMAPSGYAYTLYHTGNFNPANYLPLSGGRLTDTLRLQRDAEQNYIVFEGPNNTARGYLGFAGDNNPIYIPKEANVIYPLIHAGNIGSYNAGSADMLAKSHTGNINFSAGSALKLIRDWGEDGVSLGYPTKYQAGLSVMTDFVGWQMTVYAGATPNPYFRSLQDTGVWKEWKQLAFLTDNVASATKLQTARTIWGQSFDGTGNVDGKIYQEGKWIIGLHPDNNLYIGYDSKSVGNTLLFGNEIQTYNSIGSVTSIIKNNGNVLIGTTTDNSQRLQARREGNGEVIGLTSNQNWTSIFYGMDNGQNWSVGAAVGGKFFFNYNSVGDLAYLTSAGNLVVTGGGAFGSDVRYKDIINYTNIDLATIANAPLFTYQWNDREDKKVYLGTSAQYWMETTFKDAVNTENPNFYHLDYGALGVGLAIATARKVVDHEERIATLEKEIKELKEKLNKYETLWHN